MIRKIKTTEYLKGYDAMGDGERKDYLRRVGEWLAGDGRRLLEATDRPMAKAQNIILLSARWSKDDCAAFYEGTLLLSALAGKADTWLPTQFYAKSAYRTVRQMAECLDLLDVKNGTLKINDTGSKPKELPAAGTDMATQAVGKGPKPQELLSKGNIPTVNGQRSMVNGQSSTVNGQSQMANGPVRPKHIDQYVHLLPRKTQERAAMVKGLLTELDEAREKARLLMEAGEHPDKIELWARKATRLDGAVKGVYRELDSEWDKLVKQGRVVVDDLGNAYVRPAPDPSQAGGEDGATEAAGLTSEQRHRRRELRKWLTDTRRGNGDTREEHVIKWKESFKEYLTLEPKEKALADQKIIEAMKHYNILEKRIP